MKLYLKLSSESSLFYCPQTKVKLVKGVVIEHDSSNMSKKLLVAIKNGHVNKVDENEFLSYQESLEQGDKDSNPGPGNIVKPLNRMNKEELVKYYTDNYELSNEDIKSFQEKTKAEMLDFLEELENEQ